MSNERMVAEIAAVHEGTSKPFGVDLLTAMPGDLVGQVEQIIEGGASVFVAGLGVPSEVVQLCHSHNVLVVNMCGKVDHARRALDAGCDIVVAQGTEAGGHTGLVATMPLVPQIVDTVGAEIPVVAAGGIFDGRGLAASLALGPTAFRSAPGSLPPPRPGASLVTRTPSSGPAKTEPPWAAPSLERPCG